MLKLLLIGVVLLAAAGGVIYFRFVASPKVSPVSQNTSESQAETPIEVPKTLPGASLEDKVASLEETVSSIVKKINSPSSVSDSDSRLKNTEAAITELKAKVSSLEKATPAPAQTTRGATIYIPLGSGGGPWANTDWYSLNEYEIALDPGNYPGYTGMILEVTFRLAESAGVGSVRLYNITDSSVTSSQLDTTATSYGLQSSSSFKLATGTKTYKLQIKSSQGKDLFIQSARIKVNF